MKKKTHSPSKPRRAAILVALIALVLLAALPPRRTDRPAPAQGRPTWSETLRQINALCDPSAYLR